MYCVSSVFTVLYRWESDVGSRIYRKSEIWKNENCSFFATMTSSSSRWTSSSSKGALIHPSSRWEEPARDDELNLWDIHRKPRKLVNKFRKIQRPLMKMKVLECPICLGYLKDTTMVASCLHRFCHDCIHKCVRMGMKVRGWLKIMWGTQRHDETDGPRLFIYSYSNKGMPELPKVDSI